MAEREYVISTETTCDMPKSYYAENGINLLGLTYTIGGKDYDSAAGDSLSSAEFYQMIREGARRPPRALRSSSGRGRISSTLPSLPASPVPSRASRLPRKK